MLRTEFCGVGLLSMQIYHASKLRACGGMHGLQLGLFFSKMKSIDLAKLANLVGRPISLFTEERYRSKMADLARAHAGIQ